MQRLNVSTLRPQCPLWVQKQTSRPDISMSALPPKADIGRQQLDVRFGPGTDSCTAANCAPQIAKLLNHVVGALLELERNVNADCLCGLEVDHQFVLGRRLHRQIGRLLALENAIDVSRRNPK
jgi:hypothetical protein